MRVRCFHRSGSVVDFLRGSGLDERATQVVEFALSLPVLVLFAVGIFDFTGAITLKQKLTNAAREGARIAAADTAADIANTGAAPVSVNDAFQVVDDYLLSEKINDCLLPGTKTQVGLTWTFTATGNNCPAPGIKLTINRGCMTVENGVNVVATCVTILYPYKWQFNNISGLAGGGVTLPTTITVSATALNEN